MSRVNVGPVENGEHIDLDRTDRHLRVSFNFGDGDMASVTLDVQHACSLLAALAVEIGQMRGAAPATTLGIPPLARFGTDWHEQFVPPSGGKGKFQAALRQVLSMGQDGDPDPSLIRRYHNDAEFHAVVHIAADLLVKVNDAGLADSGSETRDNLAERAAEVERQLDTTLAKFQAERAACADRLQQGRDDLAALAGKIAAKIEADPVVDEKYAPNRAASRRARDAEIARSFIPAELAPVERQWGVLHSDDGTVCEHKNKSGAMACIAEPRRHSVALVSLNPETGEWEEAK